MLVHESKNASALILKKIAVLISSRVLDFECIVNYSINPIAIEVDNPLLSH